MKNYISLNINQRINAKANSIFYMNTGITRHGFQWILRNREYMKFAEVEFALLRGKW